MNTNPIDALDVSPMQTPPPGPDQQRAAFFGLDNTLIPGSSLFLLAQGLHQRDFYGKGTILRFAWQQFLFRIGCSQTSPHLDSSKEAALEFVLGRHRPEVRALAKEIADERIVPQVYREMAVLIDEHRSAGVLTFVATAAPAELAEIVAQSLGMTGGLGTLAEVDDLERYSGRLAGSVLQGTAKATAVEAHAASADIDLSTSVAYSDSINDLPLLELVGRAEVVNPDRKLRKVAYERGWPVRELGGRRRNRYRPATVHVFHRLAALGLESAVGPEEDMPSRGRTHHFTAEDPDALVKELEATGRFRRDTRLGGVFHPGKISLREVSTTHSLHITVEGGNRVSAHVDRYSPLASTQRDGGARYSLHRIAAHNIAGVAGDLARLIPGRRRRRPSLPEAPRTPTGESHE